MSGARWNGYDGPDILVIEEGSPDELFSDALARALSVSPNFQRGFRESTRETGAAFQLIEDAPPVFAGPETTIADMKQFLGDEEPALEIAWGVGAGIDLIVETIAFLADAGLTLYGLKQAATDGGRKVDQLIYEKQWRLFEDWRDGGPLTMELRQVGYALPIWTPAEAQRRLGAAAGDAARFFQALGYEPRRDEWNNRYWTEPEA
jgi:hypothetical protein